MPKPLGYWTENTVVKELREFLQAHDIQGWMPRIAELCDAGRGDLWKAIIKHGGLSAFAHRMGLPILSSRSELSSRKTRKMRVDLQDWMIPPL